ncbi:MAG: succinate dehydrogenase cytochrome b subunit [Deltaproteobacteria bacterium]|nr:succinate dehydrogenase cytochrome b subunit [Deltaproteobacteria bacterium]
MRWLVNLALSSIGAKVVMALTGLVLVAFLVGHMVGNLQVLGGQEPLNAYAAFLHSKPALLWVVRSGLILAAVLHIVSSVRLTWLNNAARPVAYAVKRPILSSFASRNMLVTGLVVFAFLVYHLLQFTWRLTNPAFSQLHDAQGRLDVYSMVVLSFSERLIAGAYVVALLLLGLHLWHAIGSTFQSLGLTTPKYRRLIDAVSLLVCAVLVVGNVSMPVAILMGLVQLPAGVIAP